MVTADHLLTVVDAFREARKISDGRVSTLLFNDGKRIGKLRNGGDLGSRFLPVALQWMSDHWPDDNAVWPDGVPRPPKATVVGPSSSLRSANREVRHDTPCPAPVGLTRDEATKAA